MKSGDNVSLYIHLPFCRRKCPYCHFYVVLDGEQERKQLQAGLQREWALRAPLLEGKRLRSIYFGGGTPSLFGPQAIGELLRSFQQASCLGFSDAEITLEANPDHLTLELMQQYANVGVNRVSIGLQTTDDALLKQLGRLHSGQQGLDAVRLTSQAGITNISVDLMMELPGQTLDHWQKTLQDVVNLPITHLSLYNLTLEPDTPFYKRRESLLKLIPDDQTSLKMLEMAVETLEAHGLKRYEISAFARDDLWSRHNVGYWTARPFLGLGPSAFSYWDNKRFRNVANLKKYCDALEQGLLPVDFEEELPQDARSRELLLIALRLTEGVDLAQFQEKHGTIPAETCSQIDQLIKTGFLQKEKGARLCLTERGRLFYDTIAEELV